MLHVGFVFCFELELKKRGRFYVSKSKTANYIHIYIYIYIIHQPPYPPFFQPPLMATIIMASIYSIKVSDLIEHRARLIQDKKKEDQERTMRVHIKK